jgi:hypothetical protein
MRSNSRQDVAPACGRGKTAAADHRRRALRSSERSQVIYEGSLDLAQGQGTLTIDPNTVEPWCSGAMP